MKNGEAKPAFSPHPPTPSPEAEALPTLPVVAWGRWCEGLPAGQRLMRHDGAPDVRFERSEVYSVPLYATATKAPLSERQIDELLHSKHFDKSYKLGASEQVCIDWYRQGLRDGERAHGIDAARANLLGDGGTL